MSAFDVLVVRAVGEMRDEILPPFLRSKLYYRLVFIHLRCITYKPIPLFFLCHNILGTSIVASFVLF